MTLPCQSKYLPMTLTPWLRSLCLRRTGSAHCSVVTTFWFCRWLRASRCLRTRILPAWGPGRLLNKRAVAYPPGLPPCLSTARTTVSHPNQTHSLLPQWRSQLCVCVWGGDFFIGTFSLGHTRVFPPNIKVLGQLILGTFSFWYFILVFYTPPPQLRIDSYPLPKTYSRSDLIHLQGRSQDLLGLVSFLLMMEVPALGTSEAGPAVGVGWGGGHAPPGNLWKIGVISCFLEINLQSTLGL